MINKVYQPAEFENKWYQYWEASGYFKAGSGAKNDDEGKAPPFSILLPPPNVTGTLHMGHAFQHTLMDALIRYHRMRGFDVLWQPGTDHAGIATQLVVERQLAAEGKDRKTMGRAAFIKKVWQWRHESGNIITRQMRRLGASCDWSREKFTMDDELSKTVTAVFVQLYREGLIYRGKRLVSWDPKIKTAVSDLEVENQEHHGHLWHILYPFSSGILKDYQGKPLKGMTIATTRPETMLADGALAVHPEDERYLHLIGQYVDLPLCERKIPIIADDFVDREFGSGCVKITGAHDANDYQCALRHDLELIVIMDESAKIIAPAPKNYCGLDRYDCRRALLHDLEHGGFMIRAEPHTNMLPICTRTGVVIEPMLTNQWFVKMSGLAVEGLTPIDNKSINFVPNNWVNTYRQWLNNIQDWCISRQLWWGHRIPAWFDDDGKVYVAETKEEAQSLAGIRTLRQETDVLDTWFSSALWPFSTLNWQSGDSEKESLVNRFLPTSVMITGFDIIFFWVARMVMMTEHIIHKRPFSKVHITGLVRDAEGKKMSKSVGNVIDPLDLMDGIELEPLLQKRTLNMMQPHLRDKIIADTKKHFANGCKAVGADALRFTFAALAAPGRDIKFDHHRCEGYRNFCTKLWNATRFVLIQCEDKPMREAALAKYPPTFVEQWMINRLQKAEAEVAINFAEFRFDLLARTIYELVWSDFCDWFVEATKVSLNHSENPECAEAARIRLARILEAILRLAHPLIPFITEELWQSVAPLVGKDLSQNSTIMLQPYPKADLQKIDVNADKTFEALSAIVNISRSLRSEMRLAPQQRIPLIIKGELENINIITPYLLALAKLSEVQVVTELPNTPAPTSQWGGLTLMLLVKIDRNAEIIRLEKEKAKLINEIEKAKGQLDNPLFVKKVPAAVLQKTKAKMADFQQKLTGLEQTLKRL